jgi:hypothetical protein
MHSRICRATLQEGRDAEHMGEHRYGGLEFTSWPGMRPRPCSLSPPPGVPSGPRLGGGSRVTQAA